MIDLHVELGQRSYPIFIGKGLLSQADMLVPHISGKQIFIVSNDTVAPLYLQKCIGLFDGCDVKTHILPDGEAYKTLETWSAILDALLQSGFNRRATLVALGGGVVGDMAGFAAACYQRGIAFLQIPTTLLSQVDSSVGGKTGVNHARGKNMIGAFYQPQAVLIDTSVLATLPAKELSAGLAEVIKYGLISDRAFFLWLEENIDRLLACDFDCLEYAIRRSCEIKADVVARDEQELGLRAILNLGHTFGHANKTEQGYGNWLHGEAVAVGMIMACAFSEVLGWLSAEWVQRATALIARAKLPVLPPSDMNSRAFLKHMSLDKKVLDGKIRLVLLKGCGDAVVSDQFDPKALEVYLQQTLGS